MTSRVAQRTSKNNLLARSIDLSRLQDAWDKVRTNGGCAGGDGITISRFQHHSSKRIIELSNALLKGTYRPSHVRASQLRKPDGGIRPLAIPSIVDRVAQTSVASVLTPILEMEFSDVSFAYRPGRSVDQAVKMVTQHRRDGFEWIAEGDVEKCFDRISHDHLMQALEDTLSRHESPDGGLLDLIGLWLEDWALHFGTPGRGIAQGSPLSPLLANLSLDHADERLEDAAGIRLVRFADDFVLLCKNQEKAEAALSLMREALEEIGLTLNEEKTRIASFNHGINFLGHLFVRSIVLKEEANEPDEVDELMRSLALRDSDDSAETLNVEAAEERDRKAGLNAGSRTLYVEQSGRTVSVDDGSVIVEDNVEGMTVEILRIAPARVDRIELASGVKSELSTLSDLADLGIGVDLIDGRGATRASIYPPLSDRAALHVKQAYASVEVDRSEILRRGFIEGRIANQRSLLRKLNRKRKLADTSAVASKLSGLLRRLRSEAISTNAANLESEAAGYYWPALQEHVPEWARGPNRTRNPPLSPFSSVVSYLASLATRELSFAVKRSGLHPGIGILHSSRNYAEACVYDLIEEFRAPLSEGPAVYLFNVGTLTSDDFDRSANGGVRISRVKRGAVIKVFRRTLATEFKNPYSDRRITWGGMLLYQARALARAVSSDEEYRPIIVDH